MRLTSVTALVSTLFRDRLYHIKDSARQTALPFVCLAALTLSALPAARAGTWQARANDPVYSCSAAASGGGEIDLAPGTGPNQSPNSATGGGPPGSTLSLSGTATFQWTWVPTAQEPAPKNVILLETVTPQMRYYVGSGTVTPAATIQYEAKDSSSGTVTLPLAVSATATASSSGPGGGTVSVYAAASLSPVTINPVGATPDGSGGYAILVGQHCSPVLSNIPSGCTVSNYSWSVTGSTFQSWTASSTSTSFTDGPGPLNGPSPPNVTPVIPAPSWYWYDSGNGNSTTETITCTATVTPPAGQGSPFTVTATQKVKVWVPNWTCVGIPGTMRVDTSMPNGNGDYWLYAGLPGISWTATVTSPVPSLFGDGIIELVQTWTPGMSYTTSDGTTHNYSLNGQNGLDTTYPYGWDAGAPPYKTRDSPGVDLSGPAAVSGTLTNQFYDYLMYEPPGSSQFVPLAYSSWSTNGSAALPLMATSWAGYSGSAGSMSGGGSFSQQNTFPSWTLNVGNGHF